MTERKSSPKWSFYEPNNLESIIGYELVFEQRKWTINNKTCPKRLLNPTRVSRESNATLVIQNVKVADSGMYGCSLVLTTRDPIKSKVNLVVTTKPILTMGPRLSTTTVIENQDLVINCTANGTPTPNITWVKLQGVSKLIKGQGVGQSLLYISYISRTESGLYRCFASNNPNEPPEDIETTVIVWYKPTILLTNSSGTDTSSVGKRVALYYLADGQPIPLITWYDPQGRQIPKGIMNITGGSILTLVADCSGQFGFYICQAENKVGVVQYLIKVTRKDIRSLRTPPRHFSPSSTTFYKVSTKSTTVATKREDKRKELPIQSMSFFQGRTFAIIHLTITCVLVVIIVVLIAYFYFIFKSNHFKVSDNRQEITRFARPVLARTADEDPNAVALTTIEESTTNNDLSGSASNISPNKDYENLSEKSESSSDYGNAAQGATVCDVQRSQTHHEYQELNTDVLLPNIQGYQTLNRTGEDSVSKIEPTLPPPKYEALKSVNHPQSSEYQKLHLYASIGDKK